MRTMDRNVGLIAGLVAAICFVVLAVFMEMNIFVSVVPSLLVAVAVLLVSPGGLMGKRLTPTKAEAHAIAITAEKLSGLEALVKEMQGSPDQSPKSLVLAVLVKARQILTVIEKDANKFQAAEPFKTKYIEPLDDWLKKYFRVYGRQLDFAERALVSAENETLPRLIKEFGKLYEDLHINDVAGLMQGNAVELTFPGIELNDEEFNQ